MNDIAVGIAMMAFGTGLAFYLGKPYIQPSAPRLEAIPLADWTGVPALATALEINPLFFVGIALAIAMSWFFRTTRWGLIVRTAGDSAPAAKAMGVSVDLVRFLATAAGGFLAGVGGSFLSLYYPGSWNEGLSSGQGLMAVALVIFRALGPDTLRLRRAPLRRGRGDRPGVPGDRYHPGLLLLQRRPLHPDAADHGLLRPLPLLRPRRARRALDREVRRGR